MPAGPAPRRDPRKAAAPLALGAAFAWIELGGGLYLASLDDFARAEALPFLVWRPWVLILAALAAGAWPLRRRLLLYAATLCVGAAGETILVIGLGASDPIPEMLRGLLLGAAAAAIADAVVQALRRWRPRLGSLAALLLLVPLAYAASGTRPYEALAIGPTAPREAAGAKPRLLLMTALPIVWGAGGAFDPNSRPAETYRALEREFEVTPIDAVEPATLRGHRLMLLAQPRLLAPEELVALDSWVREGARILILTDPSLSAARDVPLGDVRRPPDAGLLGPLLAHWGLRLQPARTGVDVFLLPNHAGERKLVTDSAGRLRNMGNSCRIMGPVPSARCRIGTGEAMIVADADLFTDALWAPAGPLRGHERHLRIADNPLVVADWLDGLAGLERDRTDLAIAWTRPALARGKAILPSLLPGVATFFAALLLYFGTRRRQAAGGSSTNLSTGMPTENNSRTDALADPSFHS